MSVSHPFDKDHDRVWGIVDEIIRDLRNRSGLDSMWDEMENDVQDEIRVRWMEIVREGLRKKDVP